MKCLSIKQPWATLIVSGIKPIENRRWESSYRGPLLIHASAAWDRDGAEWICENFSELRGLINHSTHIQGKIIGHVVMTNCVIQYPSNWFFGPFGFVFENPHEFHRENAIPYRGQLGIFNVPNELLADKIRPKIKQRKLPGY